MEKILLKVKEIFIGFIRPAMLYGSGFWWFRNNIFKNGATEIRMLRWMSGTHK